jgi:TRAP-type C4-dicarboxylate transport system substrate-binding protein
MLGKQLFVAAAVALLGAPLAHAQQKYEMKLAYFVGDQHAMSQWLIKWSEQLEKGSGGRLTVKRFPSAQMGPTPAHYDFARTGQAMSPGSCTAARRAASRSPRSSTCRSWSAAPRSAPRC